MVEKIRCGWPGKDKNMIKYHDEVWGKPVHDDRILFEFLILDDGSTDNSAVIARSFEDPRIHVIQNDNHRGQAFVMNQGLELARAKYVARMDADDISVPTRLAEQVRFLEDNPDIGVVGAP